MKSGEIVDAAIESSHHPLVVELPNGQQLATKGYQFGSNKRGEPVLIIQAGRELSK
jgi:hypothetical protein